MLKLICKYFNGANFQWQLKCCCLSACYLTSVATPLYAAPTSNLTHAAAAVVSQAASAVTPSKVTISIADLAKIQQQILHQEFLKKIALVEGQNAPPKLTPETKKNSLETSTKKTNSSDKKVTIKINPKHQLRVLAIYGPLAQQTAEISFNGQSHIVSNPTQLGGFKLLGIHHNKIFVQTFNLTQKTFDQAFSVSTVHSHPIYELLTGQQLEVQP